MPANPAPGTDTPPSFADYAAPSSFKDANNAGEPSIGNNFKTGATMYQAYLSTYRVAFPNGVATWTDASASAATGCPQGSTASRARIAARSTAKKPRCTSGSTSLRTRASLTWRNSPVTTKSAEARR